MVPQRLLVEANSLQQLAEPVAFRFAGPAIGGVLVAGLGTGAAFAVDAATFLVSMACVALMAPLPVAREDSGSSVLEDVREGARFVRSQPWLWATLLSAALTLLLFLGPFEVLLPFIVRNELGADADVLGVILGASGVGAIVSGLMLGQRGIGRRFVLWAYVGWGVSVFCLVGYALAAAAWVAVVIGFVSGLAFTVGNVIWVTMIHRYVPTELLARVSALDWLVSIGLTPVSFALAGPVAEAIGVEATLIGAGVLATVACFAFLAVPGIREPERWESEAPAPAPARAAADPSIRRHERRPELLRGGRGRLRVHRAHPRALGPRLPARGPAGRADRPRDRGASLGEPDAGGTDHLRDPAAGPDRTASRSRPRSCARGGGSRWSRPS